MGRIREKIIYPPQKKKKTIKEKGTSVAANEVTCIAGKNHPLFGAPPPKCIDNVAAFVEKTKQYAHVATDSRLLVDLDTEGCITKKTVLVLCLKSSHAKFVGAQKAQC